MKEETFIRRVAGLLIIIGSILTIVNIWWITLPLFVGANLFQFSFTNVCPLTWMLKRGGMKFD